MIVTKNGDVDPVFIQALQWAANKGSAGFKVKELLDAVTNTPEQRVWVQRMMLGEINGDPPLIFHSGSHHQGGEYNYFLTGSGTLALIDYLKLKEARESAHKAMYIAIASFVFAAVTGFVQIAISLNWIGS